MNIRQKIILGASLLSIIPIVITAAAIGFQANTSGQKELESQAKDKLISLRSSRQEQIESYINTLTDQLKTYANDRMIIDAMSEFSGAFSSAKQEMGADMGRYKALLTRYYTQDFASEYESRNADKAPDASKLLGLLDKDSIALQYQYIAANRNPLGQKDALRDSADGSKYAALHKKYHPHVRDFLKTFGYYDIFLVEPSTGDIIYSVYKELDYSTSLINGPYASSGLGQAFRAANAFTQPGEVATIDFAPYLPSYQDQAMFISTPIFSNGKKIGVLIFQAPIEKINNIMTSRQNWKEFGLGDSGETYLVGPKNLMRNDSRFLIESKQDFLSAIKESGVDAKDLSTIDLKNTSIGLMPVVTVATKEALSGNTGFQIFEDYRGVPVLSAFAPISVAGLNWALMAEIDESEAFAAVGALAKKIFWTAFGAGLLILGVVGTAAFFFVRQMIRPIDELSSTVRKVSKGDYMARSSVKSKDEFGQLSSALNNLLDDRIEAQQKVEQQAALIEQENEVLNDAVIDILRATAPLSNGDLTALLPVREDITGPLADSMNNVTEEIAKVLLHVLNVAKRVELASSTMREESESVLQTATVERQQLLSAVNKQLELSGGIDKITELTESCAGMAENTTRTTSDAASSVIDTVKGMDGVRKTIHETEKRIKKLGERSQEINGIVNIINTVAERTHVLALNATMQAVTAGEQGKGFAVIADEVKLLAQSAREATSQISSIVENIQLEAKGTTETMSKAVSDVVEGSRIAAVALEQMQATQVASENMLVSVQQIAAYSKTQSDVSEDLQAQAKNLLTSNEATTKQLLSQGTRAQQLLVNSRKLLESVGEFTLPESDGKSQTRNSPSRVA